MPERTPQSGLSETHASGCLVRLAWMLIGNALLGICTLMIIRGEGTAFCLADAVFWITVVVVVWLRYVDIRRLGGQTVFGQPATMDHWRRYALGLPAAALVVWAIAHAVAWAAAG